MNYLKIRIYFYDGTEVDECFPKNFKKELVGKWVEQNFSDVAFYDFY